MIRCKGLLMNGVAALVFPLALSAPAAAGDTPAHETPSGITITVQVATFRSRAGVLGCRLYHRPSGFPEGTAGTLERRVAIAGTSAACTFDNVAPGVYAVSVMHDENDNQKLDKNFLGIPTEGYGVSNNHTHAMRNPEWEESKVVVEAGKPLRLDIRLRY